MQLSLPFHQQLPSREGKSGQWSADTLQLLNSTHVYELSTLPAFVKSCKVYAFQYLPYASSTHLLKACLLRMHSIPNLILLN